MKKTLVRQMFRSALICFFCITLLTSSTYAIIVEAVANSVSERNGTTVTEGWVKPQLSWKENYNDTQWNVTTDTETAGAIFCYDKWEPGHTQVRYVKLKNQASGLMRYYIKIGDLDNEKIDLDLARVIDVYFVTPMKEIETRAALEQMKPVGTLAELMCDTDGAIHGFLEQGNEVTGTLVLRMREEAGNEYQDKVIGGYHEVSGRNGFSLVMTVTEYEVGNTTA